VVVLAKRSGWFPAARRCWRPCGTRVASSAMGWWPPCSLRWVKP